jgi:transposase
VSRDGAVPVQFRVESGNATDDRSHRETWDLLCELTGRRDFLYVADCKRATAENMAHLHQHGGRFLTVLPRTRAEDAAFRGAVRDGHARWHALHERRDDDGEVIDRFRVHEPEATTAEGYRLLWYHGARKADLDALARHRRLERVSTALAELRARLTSPRTRYRERAKVAQAVDAILREGEAEGLVAVTIAERTTETYRQERRGRPGPDTRYLRRQATRFDLSWRLDHDRLAAEPRCDGIFPLVTNVTALSALELLLAYKQQPMIETRFGQLKTDFVVAPVFLKEVSRVQALLCVYFFALFLGGVAAGAGATAGDGAGGGGEPAVVPGGSCVPPPDGAAGDRPVRGRAASRVGGERSRGRGLHHRADPPAAQGPPPAGDAQGL